MTTDSEKIIAGYRDDAVKELLVTAKLVPANKMLMLVCKNLLPVAVLLMPIILTDKKNLKYKKNYVLRLRAKSKILKIISIVIAVGFEPTPFRTGA